VQNVEKLQHGRSEGTSFLSLSWSSSFPNGASIRDREPNA
jgi:hypothetical protein